MSGLERLIPLIYHERQQQGSQLCAQHALNSVLQGDYFQAPELAQFAQQLDALEGSVNEDAGPVSNNMNDTGFFSVDVLERAIRVMGFTLVRWRSQELRDQQEKPHCQMAYILNHQEHWFSLRRFGNLADPDSGHWFNLNSFLREPEWVGKLYLGMVLSQAEDEGYSVFAVLPHHQGNNDPMVLPHTEADDIAATLPEPASGNIGTRTSISRVHPITDASSLKPSVPPAGFEDEDMELQAALQASLSGVDSFDYSAFTQGAAIHPLASFSPPAPALSRVHDSEDAFEDPIAASMARNLARNKAMMQRMQREQEMALREGYQEEIERNFGSESSRRPSHEDANSDEDEEEAIQKAIEETQRDESDNILGLDVSNDDEMGRQPVPAPGFSDRVYDDEDSELQAALKASLETLPGDFVIPNTPPRSSIPSLAGPYHSSMQTESNVPTTVEGPIQPEPPTAELDAEEIRRRRLARFGGGQ